MLSGRFRTFQHDHHFTATRHGTLLADKLTFSLPFGPAGWIVSRTIMVPHIRTLLRRRFQLLKHLAETEEWRRYLPPSS
ncbi:MAG: hypothetical protein V4555_14215 [Acidobacteriota bacterium]